MAYRLAGLIGNPVFQSRSPKIHRYWIEHHNIEGDYVLLPVKPEAVPEALRGLVALGFAGCNVTIPHKEAVAKLVDRLDPIAERMGAVNLVVVEPDGTLTGYNKDGYGFMQNLLDGKPDFQASDGPAVVLGAGGGARSVVVSLLDNGAPEVRLLNRTRARAEALKTEFGGAITVLDWGARHEALAGATLLVNTTNQGMTGEPPLDLQLDALPKTALVNDIVYNPLLPDLLRRAQARGNPVIGGLGMLLHQARPAFAAWWGVNPTVTADLRAAVEATIP